MSGRNSIIEQYDIDQDQILANKQSLFHKITGIYFLIRDSEIVYVGQSVDIINRISQHNRDTLKEFDSFYIHECPIEDLNNLEAHLIYKFRPRLNSSLPSNPYYKSFQQIKDVYGISARVLSLWMTHNSIVKDPYGLYCLSDFDGIVEFKRWMNERYPGVNVKQCQVYYLKEYIRDISTHVEHIG